MPGDCSVRHSHSGVAGNDINILEAGRILPDERKAVHGFDNLAGPSELHIIDSGKRLRGPSLQFSEADFGSSSCPVL